MAQLDDTIPAIVPEEREALKAVLNLPNKYKLPVHLYYYEGYSVAEIAEILKLTTGSSLSPGERVLYFVQTKRIHEKAVSFTESSGLAAIAASVDSSVLFVYPTNEGGWESATKDS